jgi:uncharacterized membrane protein
MQDDAIPQADSSVPTLRFSAILLPHRSLSRKGFIALMIAIGGVSFVSGTACLVAGAWPVTGFFGLDVLLVYAAFRLNYRAARLIERVELGERELLITRVHPSGRTETWSFNPYWVRLELIQHENAADELSVSSHGRKLVFGAFLSDGEKETIAKALKNALAGHKAYSSMHFAAS